MRTLLIAAVAIGGLTASAASAQVTTNVQSGGARMGGGHMGGGSWGGGHTGGGWSGGQSRGGSWSGSSTNVRVNSAQSQSQSQWQRQGGNWNGGGRTVGGDPRTWGPGNQPKGWNGPRNGGNPGTWSPGNRPDWHGGRPVGGDPRTWGPGNQPGGHQGHGGRPVGGDPRTWGPGNQPGGHQGGNWHGGSWGGGTWGGGYTGGRWNAGTRAPGGWGAYRRPHRGWTMPGYWRSPDYRITNWGFFGLQAPPAGYGWSRYYDDAVLVDDYGRVYDSVGGLDWQGYDNGDYYPSQGYANAPDAYYQGQSDPRCYKRKKGSGIGGAIIGGAIGAGIGAATGGLGTALIAGGGGALLGQQVDRESRGRVVCEDGYPPEAYGPGYGQGGYAYGYQGYAPGVTATATVDFEVPITTTTTTTTTTEEWVYPTKRKVVRKWKPRSKVIRCQC